VEQHHGRKTSRRQALTAFCPAPRKNSQPTLGGHPLPETVAALTDQPARLIRTFHVASPLHSGTFESKSSLPKHESGLMATPGMLEAIAASKILP